MNRWSWKGYIPSSHNSTVGTSCLSVQNRTDEIMSRKAKFTWLLKIDKAIMKLCKLLR